MPTLHFIASLVTSLFLIGLSLLLAEPAFDLVAFGPQGGLEAGALPQFVIIMVIVLAAFSAVGDTWKWFSSCRDRRGKEVSEAIAPADQVVWIGGGVLVLLAAYVFAWQPLPFPLITIVFVTLVSAIIAPVEARNLRGLLIIGLNAVFFSISVWLVFTYALKVHLR